MRFAPCVLATYSDDACLDVYEGPLTLTEPHLSREEQGAPSLPLLPIKASQAT